MRIIRFNRAQFSIVGPVNVSVMFRADVEARAIRLLLRNVEQPGVVQHPLRVEQIDKHFFDKLAAYLLRESNELVRLEITDSHREQIRQKVAEEQNRRASELAEAEEAKREEAERQKKMQIKNLSDLKNLKNLADNPKIKNLTDNLKGLFGKSNPAVFAWRAARRYHPSFKAHSEG